MKYNVQFKCLVGRHWRPTTEQAEASTPEDAIDTVMAMKNCLEVSGPWECYEAADPECRILATVQCTGEPKKFAYQYQLSDGRCLTTTLRGDDICKIIKLIEDGVIDLDLKALKFDFD